MALNLRSRRCFSLIACVLAFGLVPSLIGPASAQERRVPTQTSCGCPTRRWCSAWRRRWSMSTPPSMVQQPQPAVRRSDLPPLLRRAGRRRQPDAALARLRRHRRSGWSHRHQCARDRGRRRDQGRARPTSASSKPRSCSRTSAAISPCCASRARMKSFRYSTSPIPTRCRSATWCWPSAIPSASGRP